MLYLYTCQIKTQYLEKVEIQFNLYCMGKRASQVVLVVKNLPANGEDVRDTGSTPGLGRSPGGGHGNPLQYSCLENLVDRGAWQAMVNRVAKSQTQLKWFSMHSCTYGGKSRNHLRLGLLWRTFCFCVFNIKIPEILDTWTNHTWTKMSQMWPIIFQTAPFFVVVLWVDKLIPEMGEMLIFSH